MQDLHNHTIFSYDGSNTPEEIIENAIKHSIDTIAITDHQFSLSNNLNEYFEHIQHCKIKYRNDIQVLCGLEIGTRPKPSDLLADTALCFDFVLFESLDSPVAMDLYEFIDWQRLFKCKKGLAHTDIFKLSDRYGIDMLTLMQNEHLFWELNISGNYTYYYDFLTNEHKRNAVRQSGIEISIGSDTHCIDEYRFAPLKRANELFEALGNHIIFKN